VYRGLNLAVLRVFSASGSGLETGEFSQGLYESKCTFSSRDRVHAAVLDNESFFGFHLRAEYTKMVVVKTSDVQGGQPADLVRTAARNNAEWCDIVCRLHGQAGTYHDGGWRFQCDGASVIPWARSRSVYPASKTLTTTRDRPPINNTRLRIRHLRSTSTIWPCAGRASGVASRFRRNLAVVRVEEALEEPYSRALLSLTGMDCREWAGGAIPPAHRPLVTR
jgi:hypothetical protein